MNNNETLFHAISSATGIMFHDHRAYPFESLDFVVKNDPESVNMKNEEGMTPLCHAFREYYRGDPRSLTRHMYLRIIEKLVSLGADANGKDDDGNTMLHLANNIKAVKILVKAGANVNARNQDGNTLLHLVGLAKVATPIKITKYLLEHGVDINVKNNDGNTPLHLAGSFGGYDDIESLDAGLDDAVGFAQMLVDHGAKLNAQNNEGNTPLHEILFRLNPHCKDDGFFYEECCWEDENDLFENVLLLLGLLKRHGADLEIKNANGIRPADLIFNICVNWRGDRRREELFQSVFHLY